MLAYDCRGWGASDGTVCALDPVPEQSGEATLHVKVIREVLDPEGWIVDAIHAIDYIEGEPGVDTSRLGVWGSSVGGGVALCVAVRDPRVRCLVSQLGAYDLRGENVLGDAVLPFWHQDQLRKLAHLQARGGDLPATLELPAKITTPMKVKAAGPLRAAVDPTVRHFEPLAHADRVTVPTLIMDSEHEGLWDRYKHGAEAHARISARGTVTAEYRVAPGAGHDMDTYRLMGGDYPEQQLRTWAVEWFTRYLGET